MLTAAIFLMPKLAVSASASTMSDEVQIDTDIQELAMNTVIETEKKLEEKNLSVAQVVENQISVYEAMLLTASSEDYAKIQNFLAMLQMLKPDNDIETDNEKETIMGTSSIIPPISWSPETLIQDSIQTAVVSIWLGFVVDGYDLSAELLLFSMLNGVHGIKYIPTYEIAQRMANAALLREIAGDGAKEVVGTGYFQDHPAWQFIPLPGGLNSIKFDADAKYGIGGFMYSKKPHSSTHVNMSLKDIYDYDPGNTFGSGISESLLAVCYAAQQLGYITPFYTVIDNLIVPGYVPFDHEIQGDEAVITGLGNISSSNVTIPAMIRKFGYESGSANDNYMPPLNVRIGNYAFSGRTGLANITLTPLWVGKRYNADIDETGIVRHILSIGDRAFEGCASLLKITIPASVTHIGNYAFAYCENLGLGNYTLQLPYSLIYLGDYAFTGCRNLYDIYLPNSLNYIGNSAFYTCRSLKSITIPSGVKYLGSSAFAYCSNLTSATISNGVTNIESYAFYECSSLTNITIPASVTGIGNAAFFGCVKLSNITLPSRLTSIESQTFNNCWSLKSIVIPDSVTDIGSYAFYGCSSLTSVTLPYSVTGIGEAAFYGCSSLTGITIPIGVTNIGNAAFYGCSSLSNILTLPYSVTKIGASAFSGCTKLPGITVLSNITKIESNTFNNCESLTSVGLPNSITTIGYNAFYGCKNLASIIIPNSVTNIEDYAFASCLSLTSITIPQSVTGLGANVFNACTSLQTIKIKGYSSKPVGWNNSWSSGCSANIIWNADPNPATTGLEYNLVAGGYEVSKGYATASEIVIPSEYMELPVIKIADYGFSDNMNFTSIDIPDSVKSIGNYAFSNSIYITLVLIPNSVIEVGNSAFYNWWSLQVIAIEGYTSKPAGWNNGWAESSNAYTVWNCNKEAPVDFTPGLQFTLTTGGYAVGTGIALSASEIIIPSTYLGQPVVEIKPLGFAFLDVKKITIPNSVTLIAYQAFYNCTKLTSIELPDSITDIDMYAFQNCKNILTLTIPASVINIYNFAFYNWTSAQTIRIKGYASKPAGWGSGWNGLCNANIIWNC